MIDLSAAVDPALGWTRNSAKAINDSGQIAGYGTAPDGHTRAFLLCPLWCRQAGRMDRNNQPNRRRVAENRRALRMN